MNANNLEDDINVSLSLPVVAIAELWPRPSISVLARHGMPVTHVTDMCPNLPWHCLLQVMSAYLGPVTAIPQEHGSSQSTATVLNGTLSADNTTATARVGGIIRLVPITDCGDLADTDSICGTAMALQWQCSRQ
jgi:hypothetical protein